MRVESFSEMPRPRFPTGAVGALKRRLISTSFLAGALAVLGPSVSVGPVLLGVGASKTALIAGSAPAWRMAALAATGRPADWGRLPREVRAALTIRKWRGWGRCSHEWRD